MDRGGTSEQASGTCISSISGATMGVDPFPELLDRYPSPCFSHINITVTALWVATPFLSTVSVAAVCVAVSTNQWLLTQESIKNENYTGRGENEYFPKNTVSGLWTLCYTNPGKQEFFCSNIEYFPREEYSPDLKDSTMAIPYTVTKSAAFFILSTFLLFVGELCCLFGHFSRQRRLFTFISGVVFIISGLLMLIGLVMYISIFKAEVGGKLRPTSQLQPAVFTYKYGYSFILYVAGFVSTEISGTCAVFLYIYWHQKEWRRKGYELRAKFASLQIDPNIYPFCRRHPHNLSANSVAAFPPDNPTPNPHRRLYLHPHNDTPSDDERPSTCLNHSTSCTAFTDFLPQKQNQKIGTDDLGDDLCDDLCDDCPPPPPPHLCHHHFLVAHPPQFLAFNRSPRDASTNTAPPDWEDDDECSSTLHDHHFIPFDLDEGPTPVPPIGEFPHLGDAMFESLTKTTPV